MIKKFIPFLILIFLTSCNDDNEAPSQGERSIATRANILLEYSDPADFKIMEHFPVFKNVCSENNIESCKSFVDEAMKIVSQHNLPLESAHFEDIKLWNHQINVLKAAQAHKLSLNPLSKPFGERAAIRQMKLDFETEASRRLNIFLGVDNG